MRFYKILFTLTAVLSAIGVNARQMFIGNLLPDSKFTNTGIVMNDTTASAVLVTPDDVRNMIGANLKSVSAYYNDASKPKFFKVFVARKIDSDIIFEKVLNPDSVKKGWNTVDLDAPFEIKSDSLYIGCHIFGSRMGMAAKNDFPVKSFYRKRNNGEWVETTGIGVYGIVEGDNLPANDAAISSVSKAVDAFVGEPFSCDFVIDNLAAEPIRSFELSYRLGEGTHVVKSFSELDIPYLGKDTVTVDGLQFDVANAYDIDFVVTKVNGANDFDTVNNRAVVKVNVLEEVVTRNVLLELYSTERCTGCPGGHEKLDRVLKALGENEDRVIEVAHHIGFYTDKWTLPNAEEYNFFYQIITTFAPAVMLDRTCFSKYGAVNPYEGGDQSVIFGIEGTGIEEIFNIISMELDKPAGAKLKVDTKCDDTKIIIDVEGKSLSKLEDDARLTVYVTEDNLFTETQAGSVGKYYQQAVNRAYVSDQWGDAVDVNAGFKKHYTVDVKPEWNINNLNVIAFVHNSSDDKNSVIKAQGFNVYNAEKVQVKPHEVDVDEIQVAPVTVISRQDDLLEVIGDYKSGRIYNINGVEVCSMRGSPVVSTSALTDGVYVVELMLPDGNVYRTKVII